MYVCILLEENIKENLSVVFAMFVFFGGGGYIPESIGNESKNRQMGYIKLNSCTAKETVSE